MSKLRLILFLPLVALWSGAALAIDPTFTADGAAIHGYDPVAYFTAGEPTEGNPSITHEYNGATWQFASAENRDLFAADPERYAPQYGGYCAYAAAKNYVATTDPHAWSIYEDKLYLNYSRPVRALWAVNKSSFVEQADTNWPGLLASE